MSIFISSNAYRLEKNGTTLCGFIEKKGLNLCSSLDLPYIEENCCLSILYLQENDLFSMGSVIGYLYCHHMAVLVINEIGGEEVHKIKTEIDAKKMLITDIERMFLFLDEHRSVIDYVSKRLIATKDLYSRDQIRKEFRDYILEHLVKLKQSNNEKEMNGSSIDKKPVL